MLRKNQDGFRERDYAGMRVKTGMYSDNVEKDSETGIHSIFLDKFEETGYNTTYQEHSLRF